jgi:hypothetical protein
MTPRQRCGLTAAVLLALAPAWAAPPPKLVDRLRANAVESFRQARFPEAYGRFVALAEGGDAASARIALWMCLNGLELFGKDWDCNGDQLEDWSRLAGIPTPELRARQYGQFVIGSTPRRPVRSAER